MTTVEMLLMAVAVVAVALIVRWLLGGRDPRRDLTAPPVMLRPRVQVPSTGLTPELEREIRALIAERQLIVAIKRVREETGRGLKEAKDLVEAIRDGGTAIQG